MRWYSVLWPVRLSLNSRTSHTFHSRSVFLSVILKYILPSLFATPDTLVTCKGKILFSMLCSTPNSGARRTKRKKKQVFLNHTGDVHAYIVTKKARKSKKKKKKPSSERKCSEACFWVFSLVRLLAFLRSIELLYRPSVLLSGRKGSASRKKKFVCLEGNLCLATTERIIESKVSGCRCFSRLYGLHLNSVYPFLLSCLETLFSLPFLLLKPSICTLIAPRWETLLRNFNAC